MQGTLKNSCIGGLLCSNSFVLYVADMKTCKHCGYHLPLDSFQIDRKNKDGRKSACRKCSSRATERTRQATAKIAVELSLEQQARSLALKELVTIHKREYLRLLDNHRLTLRVDGKPKWIEVS